MHSRPPTLRTLALVLLSFLFYIKFACAYWLMGANNFITTQRIDPVVYPRTISKHVHSVVGGSAFGVNTSTAMLRNSSCTSTPILQDKSNYWFPHLYIQWANGTFTSVNGSAVIDYLFSDKPGMTTAFPDDFRMVSGDPNLRTLDPASFAQQAVTFLCLDFNGVSTRYNELPRSTCPSGIRSQINFPSCWDGKNTDSADHRTHVAFLSTGPDNGTCSDPQYPVTLPRIFMEVYWNTQTFDAARGDAMDTHQPFVFSNGDPTGYGYHADFVNGWDAGVLQGAVDKCTCNPYGDPTCCAAQNLFTMNSTSHCYITPTFDEPVTGTLSALPGNNPVQSACYEEYVDTVFPAVISPVFAYTGTAPPPTGSIVSPAQTLAPVQNASGKCVHQASGATTWTRTSRAQMFKVATAIGFLAVSYSYGIV
ncbi:hypothetical protein BD779DRAFT_1623261 [Infundibulicybe gibba]|nr:hypothetical protein BD779DRAFT_1623261 [Infundibulicybe gibba]